jgi:hypothetical protein
MGRTNFMQVEPNSHFWTDLNQILVQFYNIPEALTREYLIIGFRNTKSNNYELQQINQPLTEGPVFISIDDIIKFLEQPNFDLEMFISIIKSTIFNNINLKHEGKMERQEIYSRIDGERDYQDANWGSRRQMDGTPDEEKPVAEWINYIEYHLNKAKERVYHLDTEGATHELRKVAALAVRAMEIHGCPERIT